jgi:hypothetical protein
MALGKNQALGPSFVFSTGDWGHKNNQKRGRGGKRKKKLCVEAGKVERTSLVQL